MQIIFIKPFRLISKRLYYFTKVLDTRGLSRKFKELNKESYGKTICTI